MMRGLLLKDWYMACKYCWAFVVIILVFAVAAVFGGGGILIFYPVFMAGVLPVTLLSYDERSHWELYSATMPVSRRQVVTEKYVLFFIVLAVGMVVIAAAQLARMVLSGLYDWQSFGWLMILCPPVGVLCTGVLLPVIYRFGVEKGRLLYYALIVLMGCSIGAVGGVSTDVEFRFPALSAAVGLLILSGSALLLFLSWCLSVHTYCKREF